MIRGVQVTVNRPSAETRDEYNNAVFAYTPETVDNVLVAPGATDLLAASRPEGVQVAYTLHFPKTYTETLEGCTVTLPAPWSGTYRVLGDPKPYIGANTPTDWNRPVEVKAAHG